MSKNIAYILHGNYEFISRAKRQVTALTRNGHRVKIFEGIFNRPKMTSPATNDHVCLSTYEGRSPLINFLSLFLGFNMRVSKRILEEKTNFDYIICRELSTLFAGVLVKRKRRNTKLIFDSNELSVEVHSGMKKRVWNLIQRFCLPYCNVVIHAEENRRRHFVNRYKIDTERQPNILLENFPYYNPAKRQACSDQVKVIYFGGIGPQRGIEEMVQAFSQLPEFQLDLMGLGSANYLKEIEDWLRDRNAKNIRILPPIDDSLIYKIFPEYMVGIAFYPNTNLNDYFCAPNKVYQYLQSGMAVITTDNPGLRERLEQHRIGMCLKDITAESVREAIQKIVEHKYCDNITVAIRRKFSWETIENKFLSLFNDAPGRQLPTSECEGSL